MEYFTTPLSKLGTFFNLKATAGVGLAAVAWLYDPLYTEALIALFVLVLIDFVTGVAASRCEGEPIRSARVRHTATKLTAYFTMIAAGHISEVTLPTFACILDETITGYLVATELISILENMGRLGYATPASLISKLREYTQRS